MINRTKLSVIAVSAVLAVALTGCGGSASSAASSVSGTSASAPASSTAAPAADTTENGTAALDSAVESNAREMMEIRLIIEPSIAYYAALRGTEEEFQRIDEYRIRVEEVIAAGKNRTSAEQDFHNALAAATHNQFAMQLMQVVNKSIYLEVK